MLTFRLVFFFRLLPTWPFERDFWGEGGGRASGHRPLRASVQARKGRDKGPSNSNESVDQLQLTRVTGVIAYSPHAANLEGRRG